MFSENKYTAHRYAYIDALRGYAILGVISVHTSGTIPHLGGPLRELATCGQFGVHLFFVVSALTLVMSWHTRTDGTYPFYIRRLFRIAPMFWLAIPFYVMINGGLYPSIWAPSGISWWDITTTILFLHGWHPESINSVVPGGWSIAVEMTFYAVLPILVIALRSWLRVGVALLLSIVLAQLLQPFTERVLSSMMPGEPEYLIHLFAYFWFFNQLPVFLIGLAVFFSLRDFNPPKTALWIGLVLSLTLIILMPFLRVPGPPHINYALCFGALTFCLGRGAGGWLVNRFVCYLGKISYSAYLWHFVVVIILSWAWSFAGPWRAAFGLADPDNACLLFIVMLIVVTCITAGLSTISYNLVEHPMIARGAEIARSWRPVSQTTLFDVVNDTQLKAAGAKIPH
jgi:peptidoglycan/LPS O-acetylase OafA/YrhL